MSAGVVLARILAALSVTAAPAAAVAGPGPAISTGDVAAVAPGQVENTGGNVVIGQPVPLGTSAPLSNPAPGAANARVPLPVLRAPVRLTPNAPANDADAAVAKAHKDAADAHARGLAQAEEGRRQAAEASARAHARAAEARQQGQNPYDDVDD